MDRGSLLCSVCNNTGLAAGVCPDNQPPKSAVSSPRSEDTESGPLSENVLTKRVPAPPGDILEQLGATGGGIQDVRQEGENPYNNFPDMEQRGARPGDKGTAQSPPLPFAPAKGGGPDYRTPIQFLVPLHC